MTPNTTLYAVFGQPVLHSKSPQLFSPLLEEPHERYVRIRPQSAKDLVRVVRTLNLRGASITSPFKEEMLELADVVTDDALAVGAVNCLRYDGEKITGHNTDHFGVTGPLHSHGAELNGSRVLVLGAGGAARAAVYGLTRAGARVWISNRTPARVDTLAADFGCDTIPWQQDVALPAFDAAVSTILPEGIPPYMDRLSCGVLLDAIYKPSRVTAACKSAGITVISGEQWLAFQGAEAAAFYLDKKTSPEVLTQKLHERPDPGNLQILALHAGTIYSPAQQHYDLVISAFGKDQATINNLIGEEKQLAFASG